MQFSKSLVILFLLAITSVSVLAQNVYMKKVVTYVPTVLVQPGCEIQKSYTDYISTAVASGIDLPRFHFTALPYPVVENFNTAVSGITSISANSIRPVIKQTLAPDLMKILDIKKELLSKENLTEDERNTFLATKAQAAGLTQKELMAVLNSGFLYVPYVKFYHYKTEHKFREEKDNKGNVIRIGYTIYTHQLELGILWYKLNVSKYNATSISFIASSNGWHGNSIEQTAEQDDNTKGNANWSAFKDAVNTSIINIVNETKRIPQFNLVGDVQDVSGLGVDLNIGTREGVGLDDSYWVEEMQQTSSGSIKDVKRGFVKVRRVGNNAVDRSADSYAQVITGGNYSQGLTVREIPLLGMNTIIGVEKLPIIIHTFNDWLQFSSSQSQYNFSLKITSQDRAAYGAKIDIQTDLAKITGISELWFNLGGALGGTLARGEFNLPESGSYWYGTDSSSTGVSLTGYLEAGLLKKIYLRRFGFLLQADLKYAFLDLSATGKDYSGNNLDYDMFNSGFGADGHAGLEIYITPTFSIGGAAEYSYSPESSNWEITVKQNKNELAKNKSDVGPKVAYTGLGYLFWINYAIPHL